MIEFTKRFFKLKKTTALTVFSIPLVLFMLFAGITHYQELQELEHQQVKNPLPNDVYIIDNEVLNKQSRLREKYMITQVTSVDDNNVYLKVSNFIYLKVSDAIRGIRTDKLLTRQFFSNEILKLPRSQLEQLWVNGGVSEVGRSNDGMHLYGGVIIARPKQNLLKKRKYRIGTQENQLAISYYQGDMGYEQDWKEAFRLFKQGAEKGNPYSQINLAQMYRDGETVEVNLKQALYWFNMARKQGVYSAKEEYSKLCRQVAECIE
ncbi:tetratricopeptide repeat protein [Thalassotalea nanhaiensis]|uniref:Tetratricopeptide repeat protein n=1 Tax=Thalassotalea nanhaiensis TaxID=3065648 RepID=A0ABY9TM53_9GAMM|nr:tetratricopeptide repeat protein [Colwelliaceae bacterium SQ345]